jgi:hypothetical protein
MLLDLGKTLDEKTTKFPDVDDVFHVDSTFSNDISVVEMMWKEP